MIAAVKRIEAAPLVGSAGAFIPFHIELPQARRAKRKGLGAAPAFSLENADGFHKEHRGPTQGPPRQYLRTASFPRRVFTCGGEGEKRRPTIRFPPCSRPLSL
jgi:hypothetical protein